MSGDPKQSGAQRETPAGDSEEGADAASYTLKIRGGREVDANGNKAGKGALVQTEKSGTLGVSQDQTVFCIEGHAVDRASSENGKAWKQDQAYSLNATDRHAVACHDIAETLDASYYKGCGERQGVEREVVAYSQDAYDKFSENDKTATLKLQGGTYGGGSEALVVSRDDR